MNGRSPEEKFTLVFEAAKRSLLIYTRLHARLMADLRTAEEIINSNGSVKEHAADALISAVAMVDFAYRYGQLIDALPLISNRHAPLRALAAALESVEGARHHLQHMRRELMSAEPIDYPILGSLAWADGVQSFSMSFSHPGAQQVGLVWDTQARRYVRQLEYMVRNAHVDLNAVHEAMNSAYAWLAASIQTTPANFKDLEWGDSLGVGFTLVEVVREGPEKNAAPQSGI
jgi:hypothetical protein